MHLPSRSTRWLRGILASLPLCAVPLFAQVAPSANNRTGAGRAQDDETVRLSPFVVNTTSEEGYYTPESLGATRTRTELINLPINLTVFNENFINDIGARELVDIVSFASGVSAAPSNSSDVAGGDTLGMNIRGQGSFVPNRNGVRRLRVIDPVTIQRAEVIKGPNSLLYGPAAPGGGVNYITKRPVRRRIATSAVQVGSYEFYKAAVDINIPTPDKNLAFRFVGSYEDSQSWISRFQKYQKVLYPSMTWWIRPETTLTIEWEQTLQDRDPPQSPLPLHSWIDPDDMGKIVGRGWNPRAKGDYHLTDMKAFTVELQHKFNDNFNLRLNWSDVSWEDKVKNSAPGTGVTGQFATGALATSTSPSAGGVAPPADPLRIGGRTFSYGDRGSWDKYRQAELYNSFEVFGIKVQNLIGYQHAEESFEVRYATTGTAADTVFWSLRDPSTWVLSERFAGINPINYSQSTGTRAANTLESAYFINQLNFLNGMLHTMAGVRIDKIKGDNLTNPTVDNVTPFGTDAVPQQKAVLDRSYPEWPTKSSPQFGIAYKPVKGMSFFANYSTSIVNLYTTVARRSDGTFFTPVPGSGEGMDLGMKMDMFKGKVSGVISFFRADEKDIVRQLAQVSLPNVDNGAPFVPSEQSGVNRSEGVEIDLSARPMRGLQVGIGYSYNDSWVVSDRSAVTYLNGGATNGTRVETRTGHQLAYSTRHRFSGYLRKELGSIGPFTNTYVLANGSIVGPRPYIEAWYKKVTSTTDGGVLTEPGKLDGYALLNVGIGGDFKVRDIRCNMSLMLKNALDEEYLTNRNYWGNPRELLFTTRFSF